MSNFYRRRGKRLLDLALGVPALAIASPIALATAFGVRRKLGQPVLFKQERAGKGGRPFVMTKFRTMRDPRPGEDALSTDAERLTDFGRWLRSTSLDELPTLWNVVTGDMSLVGPRPLLLRYNDRYSPEQRRRLEAKPGVTGWVQVNGRNALSWDDKHALDVWYVDHLSFALDFKILLMTVGKVLKRDGIEADGHQTMPEFMGPKGIVRL